jgi:hypothetical protein
VPRAIQAIGSIHANQILGGLHSSLCSDFISDRDSRLRNGTAHLADGGGVLSRKPRAEFPALPRGDAMLLAALDIERVETAKFFGDNLEVTAGIKQSLSNDDNRAALARQTFGRRSAGGVCGNLGKRQILVDERSYFQIASGRCSP